jgi:hypothetical protein
MKALFIFPVLWLFTTGTPRISHTYGEIIITSIPAWKPSSPSGKYSVDITVPELTSEFITSNKIKVSAKFRYLEGMKPLPYTDNGSVYPGTYEYSLAPLKLTCTFYPRASGSSNGSSIMVMEQISFNFTNITF